MRIDTSRYWPVKYLYLIRPNEQTPPIILHSRTIELNWIELLFGMTVYANKRKKPKTRMRNATHIYGTKSTTKTFAITYLTIISFQNIQKSKTNTIQSNYTRIWTSRDLHIIQLSNWSRKFHDQLKWIFRAFGQFTKKN